MTQYSVQTRDQIILKGYGILSITKNMGKNLGKNISKNLINKYIKNFLVMPNNLQQMLSAYC